MNRIQNQIKIHPRIRIRHRDKPGSWKLTDPLTSVVPLRLLLASASALNTHRRETEQVGRYKARFSLLIRDTVDIVYPTHANLLPFSFTLSPPSSSFSPSLYPSPSPSLSRSLSLPPLSLFPLTLSPRSLSIHHPSSPPFFSLHHPSPPPSSLSLSPHPPTHHPPTIPFLFLPPTIPLTPSLSPPSLFPLPPPQYYRQQKELAIYNIYQTAVPCGLISQFTGAYTVHTTGSVKALIACGDVDI